MVNKDDQYSLDHDPISLLKKNTTPLSMKSLVEDGLYFVVERIYGKTFTVFAIVLQVKIYWSILEVFINFDVGLRCYLAMNLPYLIMQPA